jgi:hypothetical protein
MFNKIDSQSLKTFSSLLMLEQNKLDRLSLPRVFLKYLQASPRGDIAKY